MRQQDHLNLIQASADLKRLALNWACLFGGLQLIAMYVEFSIYEGIRKDCREAGCTTDELSRRYDGVDYYGSKVSKSLLVIGLAGHCQILVWANAPEKAPQGVLRFARQSAILQDRLAEKLGNVVGHP